MDALGAGNPSVIGLVLMVVAALAIENVSGTIGRPECSGHNPQIVT